MSINADLQQLQHHTQLLLEGLERVPDSALHWRASSDTVSIAECILHIVGFESLLLEALPSPATGAQEVIRSSSAGFRRVTGAEEKAEYTRESLQGLVADCRELTVSAIDQLSGTSTNALNFEAAAHAMVGESESVPGLVSELAMKAQAAEAGGFSLIAALVEHESYHRGQAMILNHLYSRLGDTNRS